MSHSRDAELMSRAEICAEFGTSSAEITRLLGNRAANGFPEVHHTDPHRKQFWKRAEIEAFYAARRAELPAAPEDLVGMEDVAAMLGYSSTKTLSRTLSRGGIPELGEPIAHVVEGHGPPRKKWLRSTVERVAEQYGAQSADAVDPGIRLVDREEVAKEFGISLSTLSRLYGTRDATGFPEARRTDARGRLFFAYDEVADHFARQRSAPRAVPTAELDADPDELLSKAQITKIFGYAGTSTIDGYLRLPGYFPAPDEDVDGKPRWRRRTILEWARTRPGKGRLAGRPSAQRTEQALPEVSLTGDPDELLGTAAAARLLGYKSVASFSSARSQGNIPELPEPDARVQEGRGGTKPKWRRATLIEAARQRGTLNSSS